jgi:glycerol-3-phosphate acyltransferase PlsY
MRHAGTVRSWFRVLVPATAGYVLGSIPTAVIVGRRRHVDLRKVGDRNPGWWNAKEELGRRAALPVLVVDIAKGMAAAGVGRAVARPGEWWPGYVAGAAAMVGHAWPLFARFRGGRGVATFGGVAGVLAPVPTALAVAAGAVTGRVTGSAAQGIQVGYAAHPVIQLVAEGPRRTAATGGLMTIVGLRFWMAMR